MLQQAKPVVLLAVIGGAVSPISSGGLMPSNTAAQAYSSLSVAAAASNVNGSSRDHEAAMASSGGGFVADAACSAAKQHKIGTPSAEDISEVGNKRPGSEDQAANHKNKQARSQ